jgi:SAM-dependent methyltransferase
MFGPRHEYRLGIITREVEKLLPGARILDAAVGLGQLAERMYRLGYDVVGIDSSLDAAVHVKQNAGIPVVIGDLTRLPFRTGVFGGVTSGETLEHLDDDAGAVREIARVLAPGGTCVATVPALQSLWTASDDYYEHRRRYAREQLTNLFRATAMTIEKATFWGFPIVLVYDTLVILPMNRRRARKAVQDDVALRSVARAGRSRLLVNAVRALFSLDRLFGFVPFGPGLLLVARKD